MVCGPLFRALPLESTGMNCSTEITARVAELGHDWMELPIGHRPRGGGRRGWRFWRGARDRGLFVGYLGVRHWLLRRGVLRVPGGIARGGPMTGIALFSGGRGAASIARSLLRTPGVDLSLLINGYDNGLSTGALRRYLPGMLGRSDFRKNLLLHLDPGDPRHALASNSGSRPARRRASWSFLTGRAPVCWSPGARAASPRT